MEADGSLDLVTALAAGPARSIALLLALLQESDVVQPQPGIPAGGVGFFLSARRSSGRPCVSDSPRRASSASTVDGSTAAATSTPSTCCAELEATGGFVLGAGSKLASRVEATTRCASLAACSFSGVASALAPAAARSCPSRSPVLRSDSARSVAVQKARSASEVSSGADASASSASSGAGGSCAGTSSARNTSTSSGLQRAPERRWRPATQCSASPAQAWPSCSPRARSWSRP